MKTVETILIPVAIVEALKVSIQDFIDVIERDLEDPITAQPEVNQGRAALKALSEWSAK